MPGMPAAPKKGRRFGGDAAHQRVPSVLLRVERVLGRPFAFAVVIRAAVFIEVPSDVHVRVDTAGHQRAVAEVDVGALGVGIDANDFRIVDDYRPVADDVAATVANARRTDDDVLCLQRGREEGR